MKPGEIEPLDEVLEEIAAWPRSKPTLGYVMQRRHRVAAFVEELVAQP
jgi:hypothetical protein